MEEFGVLVVEEAEGLRGEPVLGCVASGGGEAFGSIRARAETAVSERIIRPYYKTLRAKIESEAGGQTEGKLMIPQKM